MRRLCKRMHLASGLLAGLPSSLLALWQEKGLKAQLHRGVDRPLPGGELACAASAAAVLLAEPTCSPAHTSSSSMQRQAGSLSKG